MVEAQPVYLINYRKTYSYNVPYTKVNFKSIQKLSDLAPTTYIINTLQY